MWDSITEALKSGLDLGLVVTMIGVVVAGFAAVLGIWMERDPNKPPRYAYALSALILLATVVSVAQSYIDSKASEKLEEDLARMLQRMDQIAANSNDPELQELLKSELSAQSRANPDVVQKLAQRVSDEGGDPTEVLGKHLDAADVEGIARKGLIKTDDKKASAEKRAAARAKREAEKAKKEAEAIKAKAAADAAERARVQALQKAAADAAAKQAAAAADKPGADGSKASNAAANVMAGRQKLGGATKRKGRRKKKSSDDDDDDSGSKKKTDKKKAAAAAAKRGGRGR